MSESEYIKDLRANIGNSLLMIPGVAAVILDNKNRLLLQDKANEAWSLPAGMIEPGESPKEAIIREVQEETGLLVSISKVLGLFGGKDFRYEYPNGDLVEYQITLFKCTIEDNTGKVTDAETVSTQYFHKQEMPELVLPYPLEVLFDELTEPFF